MSTVQPSQLPTAIFKMLVDDGSQPSPLHPGEVLREDLMPHFGFTTADVASRIGVAVPVIEDLVAERGRITPDLAIRLGAAFAQSPGYWRALQLQYDLWNDAATAQSFSSSSASDRRTAA